MPCICSVIDRRCRQNVVRTKTVVTHEAIAEYVAGVLTTFYVVCDLLLRSYQGFLGYGILRLKINGI